MFPEWCLQGPSHTDYNMESWEVTEREGEVFTCNVLGPGQCCWTTFRGHFHPVTSFAGVCEILWFFHRLFSTKSGFHSVKAAVTNSRI